MSRNSNDMKARIESEYERDDQTVDTTSDHAGMMSIAFCLASADADCTGYGEWYST